MRHIKSKSAKSLNFNEIAQKYGIDAALPIPAHAAIIMDGNGRWAKAKMLLRSIGHENGARNVREITEACGAIGIRYLTLFAFSTENWTRPAREVDLLMSLLSRFLTKEKETALNNNVRLNTIGQIERLPQKVQDALHAFKASTCKNDGLVLTLALSYGGRDDIVRAARALAAKSVAGEVQPAKIDEALFAAQLDTCGMPDPDLVIRTGGDIRISNFLLWQMAYAEFFSVPTLWPDFTREDFYQIIAKFQKRERRFGNVQA